MADFIQEFFISPIFNGTGYNIYNTAVYAVLLIAAAFAVFKILKKLRIEANNNMLFGVVPYIVLGGLVRAMQDAGVVRSIWFITPLIYVTIFAFAFAALLASKGVEKKLKLSYHKIWFAIGTAAVLVFLVQVTVKSSFALGAMVVLSLFWVLLLVLSKKLAERSKNKFLKNFLTWENVALLGVHMFDATTTFVALTYFPYFEEHVLPSFLIGIFGPAVMFVLKFAVLSAVLYTIDKELKKDNQQRKFVKLVILILGLAPGLRNFFRLIMGV